MFVLIGTTSSAFDDTMRLVGTFDECQMAHSVMKTEWEAAMVEDGCDAEYSYCGELDALATDDVRVDMNRWFIFDTEKPGHTCYY